MNALRPQAAVTAGPLLGRLLRTCPRRVALAVADRAALDFPRLRLDPEHRRQLSVDLLALRDEFFHARDLRLDVHGSLLHPSRDRR